MLARRTIMSMLHCIASDRRIIFVVSHVLFLTCSARFITYLFGAFHHLMDATTHGYARYACA